MIESDQKPNPSFRLILEALLPFYTDGRPERALQTETFSCILKVMTPDGKNKTPHISHTFFSNN